LNKKKFQKSPLLLPIDRRLRSAGEQERAVSNDVFWYGHTGSSNPPFTCRAASLF
jgi:hypothetical protein